MRNEKKYILLFSLEGTICYIILRVKKQAQLSPEIKTRKRGSPLPVHITLYGPAALTKTNRENKNVKYNIIV